MSTAKKLPSAPQTRLVECKQDEDAGRYAVAKEDIQPGELVLLAAPYALAFNPNESASAMYITAKVEEWQSTTGKRGGGGNGMKSAKTKRPMSTSSLPLTPSAARCCNCFQRIPAGTALLNYETLRQTSLDIAVEHAEAEHERWLQEENDKSDAANIHQEQKGSEVSEEEKSSEERVNGDKEAKTEKPLAERNDDTEAALPLPTTATTITITTSGSNGANGAGAKRLKAWAKPTKSARMRSKSYVALKQRLAEAASAQRDAAFLEGQEERGKWLREARPLQWPERVLETPLSLEENDVHHGCCGCVGCGVVMYCSQNCWEEFHTLHESMGECATLRRVYSPLMKTFLTRHGSSGNGSGQRFSPQLWDSKQWLRRTNEDAAWEVQSQLLAALVVARCVIDGYATHLTAEKVGEKREEKEKEAKEDKKAMENDCEEMETDMPVATKSAPPHEVEVISRRRAEVGLEVLDKEAAESPVNALTTSSNAMMEPLILRLRHGGVEVLGFSPLSGFSTEKEKGNVSQHAIQAPRWSDVARLVSNLSLLPKELRSTFRTFYRNFLRVVVPWLQLPLNSVSESFFDRMSGAAACNGFGLYDTQDACFGIGLYPDASYFNHSCLPNLCRRMYRGRLAAFYAIRPIRKGDALTICYVDVQEISTAERRRTLLTSYRFYCQCERCGGESATSTGAMTAAAAGLRLCSNCTTRGYLRPLPPIESDTLTTTATTTDKNNNINYKTWEVECTICHNRGPSKP